MLRYRERSVHRFILLLAAVMIIFLLPVSTSAGSPDDPDDTDTSETLVIPDFADSVYGYTYTGNSSVVTIPADITELNHYIFSNNNSIRAVIIPGTVAYVSDYAFYKCSNLRYICFFSGNARVSPQFIYKAPSLINISAPKNSDVYKTCIRDQIPVTASKTPCFEKKSVYMLPKDTAYMPLYNSLDAVYRSGNKKIVTVDKHGKIHAKKKGKTYITAVSGGKEFRYKVIVFQKSQNERVKQIRKSEKLSSGKTSTVRKIKAAHDWMIRNVSYDYDSYLKGNIPGVAHTSKGSLIRKLCVCDGYAYGFQMIMKSLHIPCKVVRGKANGGSHAWNMVRIGKKWYHVDVTWDDPVINQSNSNTTPRYDYFLKSTEYMKKHSHSFQAKKYPKCTSQKYDKKGISADSKYRNMLDQIIYSW